MPSKLPVMRLRTCDDNIVKMKVIAKHNKRSLSKELEKLVEKHIEEFEKTHGEIEIYTMNPSEIIKDVQDRIVGNPPYGN